MERNKKILAKEISSRGFFVYLIVQLFSAERETLEVNNGQFLVGRLQVVSYRHLGILDVFLVEQARLLEELVHTT